MSNGLKFTKNLRAHFPNVRKTLLGLLFLTFPAGALGSGSSYQLYALQNGAIVTSVAVGSTFEIQATHVKASDIYLFASPGGYSNNPYSFQSLSQAACIGNSNKLTCTWTYANGGSPELYSGTWCFTVVEVSKNGTVLSQLQSTTINIK
jgi:hypothetical protein